MDNYVTPRAEAQGLPMFGFLNTATTFQRARPLVVKVAPFSPGERGRGRVGFKKMTDIREGDFLWLAMLQPHPGTPYQLLDNVGSDLPGSPWVNPEFCSRQSVNIC